MNLIDILPRLCWAKGRRNLNVGFLPPFLLDYIFFCPVCTPVQPIYLHGHSQRIVVNSRCERQSRGHATPVTYTLNNQSLYRDQSDMGCEQGFMGI